MVPTSTGIIKGFFGKNG